MTDVEIRPVAAEHLPALRSFLEQVSEGDRTFFRRDLLDPGGLERWLLSDETGHVVALAGGEIAGLLLIEPGAGRASHVGEVRIVVGPSHRRRGIGRALARAALLHGLEHGLDKLVVQVAAEDVATVSMFRALAFEPEALLRGHARDEAGEDHDLLVLSHFASQTRDVLHTIGLTEELG